MAQATQNNRWLEIQKIWQANRWLYVIAGVFLGILITPAIEQITGHLNDLIGNLVPEAISVLFTILILDRLAENRATEALKKRLIREASGQSNETAKVAIDWLRDEGWLTVNDRMQLLRNMNLREANLKGANLWQANLNGADLEHANLEYGNFASTNLKKAVLLLAKGQGINLEGSNLKKAILRGANLENANMRNTNLTGADLLSTNLQGAILFRANLANADLGKANLNAARMRRANLRGANLENTSFDIKTLLPDAEYQGSDEKGNRIYDKYWTPETDMTRYTDPNHPDFWQPDWVTKLDE